MIESKDWDYTQYGTQLDDYYRYDTRRYSAGVDEFDNPLGPGRLSLELRSFPVYKITPKGVWVNDYGSFRFVLATARSTLCYPTHARALENFIARKKRYISILDGKIAEAEEGIQLALRLMEKDK